LICELTAGYLVLQASGYMLTCGQPSRVFATGTLCSPQLYVSLLYVLEDRV